MQMQIVIASSNIFRRELSTFVLSEAGYQVSEVVTRESLLLSLSAPPPALVIVDASLSGPDPLALLRQIRGLTSAPILWITPQPLPARALSAEPVERLDWVSWPYNPTELLVQIARLLQPAGHGPLQARPELRRPVASEAG